MIIGSSFNFPTYIDVEFQGWSRTGVYRLSNKNVWKTNAMKEKLVVIGSQQCQKKIVKLLMKCYKKEIITNEVLSASTSKKKKNTHYKEVLRITH